MLAEFESGLRVGRLLISLCLAKPRVQKALEPEPLSSNSSSDTSFCDPREAADPSEPDKHGDTGAG